jgi:hypothetical protein
LQAGQLVQCSQCTTIFRVPADGTIFGRDRRPTRQSTNAPAYFEPWTPRTKKREEISTGQPVAADLPVVKLQASLYGVKPDPPIDAQLVKPWEPVPDEALIESRRGERSARARKRIAIIAGIIAAVCCLAIVVVLIIVFRQPTP